MAVVACQEIIDQLGVLNNHLFIQGKSGTGKTHLLNAIAIRIREQYPDKSILFITANI